MVVVDKTSTCQLIAFSEWSESVYEERPQRPTLPVDPAGFDRQNGHLNGICPGCDGQMIPGELRTTRPASHRFCEPSQYSWLCVDCKCVTPMM